MDTPRALAVTVMLEEKIERVSPSITRGWPEYPCPFPELQPMEEKVPGLEQVALQGLTRGQPCLSPTHRSVQWGQETLKDEEAEQPFLEFNLGPPP